MVRRFDPGMTIASALKVHPGVSNVLKSFGLEAADPSNTIGDEAADRSKNVSDLLTALENLLAEPAT
ncbi:MAG: hypothetical protein PHW95_02380 [Patescibacteria group bacterium]|nr:hypothetical protein [Patescibacteria group bacterium]